MTLGRMHHPKADLSRMYIPRKEKGQGITKLEMIYKITTTGLNSYLQSSCYTLFYSTKRQRNFTQW